MDKFSQQQNHCAFRIKFLKTQAVFAVVLSLLLLAACGIEDYPYLDPVRESNISWEFNTRAAILLPYVSSQQFTHFAIYYRIYISDESILSSILPTDMAKINDLLDKDYKYFLPYINSDNMSGSTQIDTYFANRKYYSLYTESGELNDILSKSVMGQRIVLDFSQTTSGRRPILEIGGTEYVLWRTTGREREIFEIKPNNDRSFVNSSELNSSEYADSKNNTVNNDVADKDKMVSGNRYTYVAMYIVATGQDMEFKYIYSQPDYIGVFRLPDT
jgi:hypothetical protein